MNLNSPLLLWHDPDKEQSGIDIFDDHEVSTYYNEDMDIFQIEDMTPRHKMLDKNVMLWIRMDVKRTPNGMNTMIDKEVFSIVSGIYKDDLPIYRENVMPCDNEEQAIERFNSINNSTDLKRQVGLTHFKPLI